jgi:hypothetical protein
MEIDAERGSSAEDGRPEPDLVAADMVVGMAILRRLWLPDRHSIWVSGGTECLNRLAVAARNHRRPNPRSSLFLAPIE